IVSVASQFGSLETFAYVYPGVRPDTVAIQAGLGHTSFGRYTDDVGVNPNLLLGPTVDAGNGRFAGYGQRVRVSRVAGVRSRGGFNPPDGLFEQGSRIQHDREIAQAI